MLNKTLLYLDSFDTELHGKQYKIFTFLESSSLRLLYGTNLDGEFTPGKAYDCVLDYVKGKLKVTSAKKL